MLYRKNRTSPTTNHYPPTTSSPNRLPYNCYRFDSDEPQYMHVAWAWARGMMQYRNVFDNQMPLFHIFSAPLFFVAGDD